MHLTNVNSDHRFSTAQKLSLARISYGVYSRSMLNGAFLRCARRVAELIAPRWSVSEKTSETFADWYEYRLHP